jgi:hypothetical protein
MVNFDTLSENAGDGTTYKSRASNSIGTLAYHEPRSMPLTAVAAEAACPLVLPYRTAYMEVLAEQAERARD